MEVLALMAHSLWPAGELIICVVKTLGEISAGSAGVLQPFLPAIICSHSK